MRLEIKINKEKQTNKQTIATAATATTKTKASKKQKTTATTEKVIPSQPQPIFSYFTSSLPVSISKISLLSTVHLLYEMMLFIMSHFFVKAIGFIELDKAISFSILISFRISAMRLFY